jgi:hypothetical protein
MCSNPAVDLFVLQRFLLSSSGGLLMNEKIEQALNPVLRNWKAMSGSGMNEAEAAADMFESSFYDFIEEVRVWIHGLDHKPQTLYEAYKLPLFKKILALLPDPLLLNFETEIELILEDKNRIDEDKYD